LLTIMGVMTRRTLIIIQLTEERDAEPIETTAEVLDEEASTITRALRPLAKCGLLAVDDVRRKAVGK
jgi:predicted transcriptional regulator